ncbi:MAG: branched-chain amino acid transport system permease protein livM [Betaproteobacteria bacterium]|nr:branched-chain amino acid transport system permease protein livM [Betaproteobacteria bacterium]
MSSSAVLLQFLNGLASASSLFLVAAGLSLIFGVTRIVNFAHGSLYMLGMYVAVWLAGRIGFWAAVPLAAVSVAALGACIEILLLRRIYRAPELLQLLATFALVLIVRDFALWAWGPEDLLGPRAPGFAGALEIAGRPFPQYDLLLILLGPLVFAALHFFLTRTRWGVLVRAAAQDREMAGALGVNQRWLFTGVFTVGAALAGLGGALAIPREPASLGIDLALISDAFVVVVIGGLGSIPGAFIAALLIGVIKAFCIGLGYSKLTLVAEFVVMAMVLVLRPWGLLGKPLSEVRGTWTEAPLGRISRRGAVAIVLLVLLLAALPSLPDQYPLVLATEMLVFALFAASLHLLMGPGGMASFGHAAYFGVGAYASALVFLRLHWSSGESLFVGWGAGALAAAIFGWFCVRLSGVYLAMLTLAFAQIVWSVAFQWDTITGGSNGLVGIWPQGSLSSRAAYYYLVLAVCGCAIFVVWRMAHRPFGYALRASRDSPLRASAIGINVRATQWTAFILAGSAAGVAGALYSFSKGSLSPETLSVQRSVDGLVMVLLGGVHTLTGPVWGAAGFIWLQDAMARSVEYWRAATGAVILLLVFVRWRFSA